MEHLFHSIHRSPFGYPMPFPPAFGFRSASIRRLFAGPFLSSKNFRLERTNAATPACGLDFFAE